MDKSVDAHKSVQEIIEQWKITLGDCENCGDSKEEVYLCVYLSEIETVVKYFDDLNTFENSI